MEKKPTNRRNIVISHPVWSAAKEIAKREGRSVSDIVREGLINLIHKKHAESGSYDPIKDKFEPNTQAL